MNKENMTKFGITVLAAVIGFIIASIAINKVAVLNKLAKQ